MIKKVGILLRVQQLEKSRRWVPLDATPNFVHLVNQDEWVFRSYFLEALDDFARHCTHVRSPVSLYLSNIRHTTHTEAKVLQEKGEKGRRREREGKQVREGGKEERERREEREGKEERERREAGEGRREGGERGGERRGEKEGGRGGERGGGRGGEREERGRREGGEKGMVHW